MSIYRGPGGSGDAVNDSSSEATLVSQLVTQAQTSEANAAASATAAQTAENNAETAETNAETSATNAASSAASALSSKNAAATSATNAASSASAASTSASNAATSATNASNSATSASTSASTATTQATNASNSASAAATSATNAASSESSAAASATTATNSANSAVYYASYSAARAVESANSATAAATSATNAASSATTATTQAGIATTQATNAASSASAASTSASNAATSATSASNSASTATTQATNASNSATSAATSATNAAASYDAFDDRYLGSKSSAPSVDNDGNTLLVGALYYNTVSSSMKVWSGSAWLDAYASLSGALIATNNLSDLNNTDTARTNLGLGTIATQTASSVAITGGAIDGTTVGATTASSGRFTSLSDSGNLTFTGTGNRITGDFSNGTIANRVIFQTSNTNGGTTLTAIPNGISGTAQLQVQNSSSDLVNFSYGLFRVDTTTVQVRSDVGGTGTQLPLTMWTGGSERLRIDTSGNVGIGTSSPVATLHIRNFTASFPATSGTTQTGDAIRIQPTGTNGILDIGQNSSSGSWLQSTNASDLSLSYPLLLNPNGGNVGIGTSSPSSKLNVYDATSSIALVQGDAASNIIVNRASTDASPPAFAMRKARGTIASPTAVASGDQIGQVFFQAYGGTNNRNIASIAGVVDTYTSDSNISAYLTFGTSASGAATTTERMRIDSSGNVGIGTSSPNASAILDAQSTTKGVRMPNMTTTQKNAISSPAAGLMVFDTTLAKLCVYSGSAWQTITSI